MSLASNALALLVTEIKSVWTGLDVLRVHGLNIDPLEERLIDGDLTTDIIIIRVEGETPADYGANNRTYESDIYIYYVTTEGRNNGDVQDFLDTKIETLKLALYAWQDSNVTGSAQILKPPVKNIDASNDFNRVAMQRVNGLMAGELRVTLLYGDTP